MSEGTATRRPEDRPTGWAEGCPPRWAEGCPTGWAGERPTGWAGEEPSGRSAIRHVLRPSRAVRRAHHVRMLARCTGQGRHLVQTGRSPGDRTRRSLLSRTAPPFGGINVSDNFRSPYAVPQPKEPRPQTGPHADISGSRHAAATARPSATYFRSGRSEANTPAACSFRRPV
jgi:hypothetical protein